MTKKLSFKPSKVKFVSSFKSALDEKRRFERSGRVAIIHKSKRGFAVLIGGKRRRLGKTVVRRRR